MNDLKLIKNSFNETSPQRRLNSGERVRDRMDSLEPANTIHGKDSVVAMTHYAMTK